MDQVLENHVNISGSPNDVEYYFSFLTDRFEFATTLWTKALEKKFGKRFEPIFVIAARQNGFFNKDNFVVINGFIKKMGPLKDSKDYVYLPDQEDLNKEFSASPTIRDLMTRLMERQQRVFILPFTSSFLTLRLPGMMILGPDPDVATLFDNKVEQLRLFEELGLPRNQSKVYGLLEEVSAYDEFPFYISPAYTSGGHESGAIWKSSDLEAFQANLRSSNKQGPFIVSNLIQDLVSSPNVSAVVCGPRDTRIICVTDQILRNNQYLGNIYPSTAKDRVKQELISIARSVGDYLSAQGFRGVFGLDFIIGSKGGIYTIDLNPRRQGGYLCNLLMSRKVSLVETELAIALGESVPSFDSKDFEVPFCWAHTKLKPYHKNTHILKVSCNGNPSEPFLTVGKAYVCTFYPQGAIFEGGTGGYMILSGNSYEEVKQSLIEESERLVSTHFGMYQGV